MFIVNKVKVFKLFVCSLCFSFLSGVSAFAQNDSEDVKVIELRALVWGEQKKLSGGGMAQLPASEATVRITLPDGSVVSEVTNNGGMAFFKGLPAGSEYIAEVSVNNSATAIYHGILPDKNGPRHFYTNNTASSDKQSFFEDPGQVDVEGFVVRPAPHPFITAPLAGAVVLYTSDEDSIYTTTDQHGYFRFDAVNNKNGKISVSHENYKAAEAVVPAEDGSRWLWVRTEGQAETTP